MNKEVNIALLEGYLAGDIEASEVLALDGSQLSADELQSAIEDYKEAMLMIEGAALKEELKAIHQENDPSQVQKSFPRWLAAAASIVLIGVFGTLIWQSTSSEPEFSDYFDHFDQLVTYRDSDSTNYSAGLEAYTLKDYEKAYLLLENIDNLDDELKFYLAVSALGSERFQQAIEIFEGIGTDSSNKYYQQIRWYLGLAYWQIGEADKARETLALIADGAFKYEESVKLKSGLED